MKYSEYNHFVKIPNENSWLLYNTLSDGLIKLDDAHKKMFESILSGTDHEEDKIVFLENGFLVDDYDEKEFINVAHRKLCNEAGALSLLIAPTMDCNFACPYCFETHHRGMMSSNTQDLIIDFIEKTIQENHHKSMFVYWFGGEPLLGLDIIIDMSRRIIEIAKKNSIKYSAGMATNGFLLTPDVVLELEKCNLERIQVTIDGTKQQHDKTRKLKNGDGSFDKILDNLSKIRTKINIVIRSNINLDNRSGYLDLRKIINGINEKGGNYTIYAARMDIYEKSDRAIENIKLEQEEFCDYIKNNNLVGSQRGKFIKFISCDAEKVHSYGFDEKGNMYKCWNDVGDEDKAFSKVDEYMAAEKNVRMKNLLPYLSSEYHKDEECDACKLLPICMGGCILKRRYMGNKECAPAKYNFNEYILSLYYSKNGGEMYVDNC